MTQTAVAAQIHQALDVHRNFTAQITFNMVIAIDCFTNLQDFRIGQLIDATLCRDADLLDDFLRKLLTNPVNVLKRDNNALVRRDVDASDTSHVCSPC